MPTDIDVKNRAWKMQRAADKGGARTEKKMSFEFLFVYSVFVEWIQDPARVEPELLS